MSKIQGEGDYESARKYNDKTRKAVEKMDQDEVAKAARQKETAAEAAANKAGREKSQAGQKDQRDARIFRDLEKHDKESDKGK